MWIAALAAAHNIPLHPLGVTGLDRVTGIHVLSAVDNPGYFESSEGLNPLREGPFFFTAVRDWRRSLRTSLGDTWPRLGRERKISERAPRN